MSRPVPAPVLAVALALSLALFALLQAPGLAFHREDRLRMVSPAALERVEGPVELRWKVSAEVAEAVAARRAYFAVFVDRPPIAPGESLAVLADDACRRQPGCPDRDWLAARHVHVSLSSALVLPVLPQRGWGLGGSGHEATVVLIGADGLRWGEDATGVRFVVEEER